MPRKCTVCTHPARAEVDRSLIEGGTFRGIARQYPPLTATSVERHKKHLPTVLVSEAGAERAIRAQGTLEEVKKRLEQVNRLLDKAETKDDLKAASGLLRGSLGFLELQARLSGELQERGAVAVQVNVNANGSADDSDMSPAEVREVLCSAIADGFLTPSELRCFADQLESGGVRLLEGASA